MQRIVVGLIFLLASYRECFSQANQVDQYVKEEMRKAHIPGMSVAVVSQGKVIFTQQYGMVNV